MFRKLFNSLQSNKVGVKFSMTAILMGGITAISGIIILKWLLPSEIGLWQSIYTISVYLPIIQLGINNGLNRQLPILIGRGEHEQAYDISRTALAYNLFVLPIILVTTFIIAFVFFEKGQITIVFTVLSIGIILSGLLYQNYLTVTYRNNKSFENLSKVYIIQSLIIIGAIPLVKLYNYNGLILYNLVVTCTMTLLLHFFRPIKRTPRFVWKDFKSLIKIGLPIYIIGYITSVSRSFPRLVLIFFGNVTLVGLYAPASAVQTMLMIIPNSIAQYIYPRMSHRFGETNDSRMLWGISWKSSIYPSILMIPIAVIGYFLIPIFISGYFPKYNLAIGCAQWTILSSVFSGSLISSNVFFSISKYTPVTILAIIRLLLFAFFPFVFFKLASNPLTGIGIGIFTASVLIFFINQLFLYVYIKSSK